MSTPCAHACQRIDDVSDANKVALIESALIRRDPSSPDIECIRRDGWVQWIRRGVPSSLSNRVWWSQLADDEADRRIMETIATYRTLNLPLMWMLSPSSRPKNLSERLVAHGFRHMVDVRGMFAYVEDLLELDVEKKADGIAIEMVHEANMEEWLAIYSRAWNVNEVAKDAVRKTMIARFDRKNAQQVDILARCRGDACAVASLDIFEDFALFINGFVFPEYRHRGIFRDMVAFRAKILQQRGIPYAVIHALAQTAAPLLVRMGFADVCEMSAYTYP